ncbi:hypothetical protein H7U35_03880 [Mediterranea massiliensis]|uniref:Uncharacterized protein n=1 Tax=Mediterranea massiliensis TaxID=1841865 RepID=A0ABS2DYG4_9BACT|nr:hypothetical protein [Mediterranea massiliensis]MBM6734369.1 hypothetical protein [Mediterranea massiliensis]
MITLSWADDKLYVFSSFAIGWTTVLTLSSDNDIKIKEEIDFFQKKYLTLQHPVSPVGQRDAFFR